MLLLAIVAADATGTGTWVLNQKAKPCIRALKTADTQPLHQTGLLAADAFAGIQQVCFGGEVNAAPALAGQTAGLIHGVKSVQAIIDQTVAQFFDSTGRLAALAALAAARNF